MVVFHTIKWSYGNRPEIKDVKIGKVRFGMTRVTREGHSLAGILSGIG